MQWVITINCVLVCLCYSVCLVLIESEVSLWERNVASVVAGRTTTAVGRKTQHCILQKSLFVLSVTSPRLDALTKNSGLITSSPASEQ